MNIRTWLRALDLKTHAAAFEENAIDLLLLPDLTDDDLKTLGVAALGYRKKILKAATVSVQ